MFKNFLNERSILSTKTSANAYGKTTNIEKEIKSRKEEGTKIVINPQGKEVVSTNRVFTENIEIDYEDKIDGKKILEIKKVKNYKGKTEGKEVYLQ